MAKSRRKDPSDYLEGKTLLDILTTLSKVSYFEITVLTKPDYDLVEEYFEAELESDPEYLGQYTRIMECTMLLDSFEYQAMVLQLCGIKEIARNTKQYIHSIEIQGGELCIINLYRELGRQLKKRDKSTGKKTVKKSTKSANAEADTQSEQITPDKIAATLDKQLSSLERRLKKAVELEDYHHAAHLQKEIEKLRGE